MHVSHGHRHHEHCWEVISYGVPTILETAFVPNYPFKNVYISEARDRISL